jgi:hypothetical protein
MSEPIQSLEGQKVVLSVVAGKSIVTAKRVQLKEHTVVDPSNAKWMEQVGLTETAIEKLRNAGMLVTSVLSVEGQLTTQARDVVQINATLPGAESGPGIAMESASPDVVLPPPGLGAPEGQAPGKWGYDPATLQGNSIEELNGLVLSIDSAVQPFPTVEEARSWLSQDFRQQADSADRVSS